MKTITEPFGSELQFNQEGVNVDVVFFIDPQHGWTIGGNGTIVHTADGGLTWHLQISGTNKLLRLPFLTNLGSNSRKWSGKDKRERII